MKIKRLVIENFKSIERIELIEPNPFTVFVGPNGSGKSNIFEALEFVNLKQTIRDELVIRLFGGTKDIVRKQAPYTAPSYAIISDEFKLNPNNFEYESEGAIITWFEPPGISMQKNLPVYRHFINFTRLFINKDERSKLPFTDDLKLSSSAMNLEKVLKRVLTNPVLRNEIFEWLELFIPGFKAVEVDDRDELHWFEQSSDDYFTKDLISDGTYNILALLTAVYQSDDKPQFLCIEEPENGLHPQVAGELVDFFRIMCEERGHYIWLNTHSQTMLSRLKPEETVVVQKEQGATKTYQFKDRNLHGLRMDEALLMNVLGVGLAW
jgi:predicted ATPase